MASKTLKFPNILISLFEFQQKIIFFCVVLSSHDVIACSIFVAVQHESRCCRFAGNCIIIYVMHLFAETLCSFNIFYSFWLDCSVKVITSSENCAFVQNE